MVAQSSPDWLPAGWSVQFRQQRRGRKAVVYTHLETGRKFFYKDDVIRHTGMAITQRKDPQAMCSKNSVDKIHLQLAASTDEFPEWLPDGWKVELRTRKTGTQAGKEYKCYIDPSRECTFYSKPEVFRYLKTVKHKSCKSSSDKMVNRKRCIIKMKNAAVVLLPTKVVVEKHDVEDLPPGWILEVKVKKVANRIRRDPYYTDPVRGYVFRSKKEVIHYLQTGEISRHTIKPKSMTASDFKLIKDEIAITPSSAAKQQTLEHPVTWRQLSEAKKSSEMSGLELPESEISKLQDKRTDVIIGALASKNEVVLEKHLTENLVEECAETKTSYSPCCSSERKAEPSGRYLGKRSSQRIAELSDNHEGKRSKLQDERVTSGSKLSLALAAEECAKTKKSISASKSSQPKAELFNNTVQKRSSQLKDEISDKSEGKMKLVEVDGSSTDPGKVMLAEDKAAMTPTTNSQIEKSNVRRASRSKAKEKLNLPRRSSKRLAGLEPEPVKSLVSSVQTLQVASRKLSKGDGIQNEILASADFVYKESQHLWDASETEVAHHTLTEVKPARQVHELLCKVKRPLDVLELQPVETLVSSQQTLQVATRKSNMGDARQDAGLFSNDIVHGTSLRGDASEPVAVHNMFTELNFKSNKVSSHKGKMVLDDQVVLKELHHKQETEKIRQETEKMDVQKPGPDLCFLFGSDPCLEFAFKTLTGELPIPDTDNRPILDSAADMLQKESSLEGRGSRKTRAVSNKSKKVKEHKLPHRTSKRLAGVEPELPAEPMSSERAFRNAISSSCRSKAIPAVDLPNEESQQFDAGQAVQVAKDPCTTVNPSPHDESNKIGKYLADPAIAEEKPQTVETEKAAVENTESQFTFPFLDNWSDPCLDFAFKTLTGEIPIEEDLLQDYFRENLDNSQNQRESFSLPDFNSPSFLQTDITPQFTAPEQSISGQQFPLNSLPPAGNVSLSNCNGVGFGQQLSMNSSFLPAGNVRLSNSDGVGSSQQSLMSSSFLPAGNLRFSNTVIVGSGQQLSMNSSFLPAANVPLSSWNGVDTQKPCL